MPYSFFRFVFIPLITSGILTLSSCQTDPAQPQRKIRQSNLVYEDNVNGRLQNNSNIEETTNFYYNPDGSLGRVSVYEDTSVAALLLKDITVEYVPDSSKVILNTYSIADGYRTVELYYNSQQQITRLVDLQGNGLFLTYSGNRITNIRDSSGAGIVDFVNFAYDINGNLVQYELSIGGAPPIGRATLQYNTTTISEELDTRFFNKDIKFIYIGGLNLVTKLGLNFGLHNRNTLIKRTESEIATGTVVNEYYFGYLYNDNNEIIKRNIRWNTDTLFYQFKY